MAFDVQIKQPQHRPAAVDRVRAGRIVRAGRRPVIALYLSGDIAQRLELPKFKYLRVSLGTGEDQGWLRLARARASVEANAFIPAFKTPGGQQYTLNIRAAFLGVDVPDAGHGMVLPHQWSDHGTLSIDFRPLQPQEATNG